MKWKACPAKDLLLIRKLDRETEEWVDTPFPELQPGDIYRAFMQDGTLDMDDVLTAGHPDAAYFVTGRPFRNEAVGRGYSVEVEVGSLPQLLARANNA